MGAHYDVILNEVKNLVETWQCPHCKSSIPDPARSLPKPRDDILTACGWAPTLSLNDDSFYTPS